MLPAAVPTNALNVAARQPLLPVQLGWERWQGSRLSKRLLPDQARQEGHSVVRVPAPMRDSFLAVATIYALYERDFHRTHQTLSPDQLAAFVTWHEATQGLLAALQKGSHA